MAQVDPSSPRPPNPAAVSGPLPVVRLEVRSGPARPVSYDVSEVGFLIGSVAGCDLRLPGTDLPPVICLIAPSEGGAAIRKLVPTYPVAVNGRSVTSGQLANGDAVTLGSTEILVHVERASENLEGTSGAAKEISTRNKSRLTTQTLEQHATLATARADLEQREQALQQQREELERQQKEFASVRQELADIRQQLYERYRHRCDRLAGLHEAINRATRKVQERKQQVDADQAAVSSLNIEVDARAAEQARIREQLEEQSCTVTAREQELERESSKLQASLHAREEALARDRDTLQKNQAQYQADLVRLDRLEAALEKRQQQLQERAREIDARFEQMQQTSRELEDQARDLDVWQEKLRIDGERLSKLKTDHENVNLQMAQRAAALEGQQAMLASLRTRLERLREELRREQQQLAEQRTRLDASDADLQRRAQENQQLRAELDAARLLHEQERQKFEECQKVLEAAVEQLRQTQEAVSSREEDLNKRASALDASATRQAEEGERVRTQSDQFVELQKRLNADRQALEEREGALIKTEQARAALQEQLRRRSEELAARQHAQAEQTRKQNEELTALEARRAELEQQQRQAQEQIAAQQQELVRQTAELAEQRDALTQREKCLHDNVERFKEAGRNIETARNSLENERVQLDAAQAEAKEALARSRAEFEASCKLAHELRQLLPELELRAQAGIERLAQARAQLREHLGELHAYARQSQEDIETLRTQVQLEAEQVRQQQLGLHRAREEHRLAVAGFRQQLIEWQGQLTEMRQSLLHGETRLERRQAHVEEQTRQLDANSARLSQQAEQLQEQERVVEEQRAEMDRHLNDMREWYRRKLRELSERRLTQVDERERANAAGQSEQPPASDAASAGAPAEAPQDILSLTEEVEPGDRKLGDLLRSLDLVDADTLNSLLIEARRQRRSLRQVLLASGYLTLYQMALIETGNLDGLVLGPLRVIDRLRLTPREAVYRVFDPRRSQEAILRHLTEAELEIAGHAEEFSQGFTQALAIKHPHVVTTLEVLEIAGRPAVLQESLTGLYSLDWPVLAAVPGVWYRLLCQAALGLNVIHQVGIVHGHLHAGQFLLTSEGLVKLCGVGEPLWLALPSIPPQQVTDVSTDLGDFGKTVANWASLATRRKGARPLPEPLQTILNGLISEETAQRYANVAALLEELDSAGANIPANAEAWDRLLRYVREHAAEDADLRQSA